jgi:glycosyltransferase involved in cell wall biosynthesis
VVPSGDAAALADRLTTLNADPELRLSMGRAGRQRVDERYTRSLMTQSYEALFDEILRERGVSDWPGSTHA